MIGMKLIGNSADFLGMVRYGVIFLSIVLFSST